MPRKFVVAIDSPSRYGGKPTVGRFVYDQTERRQVWRSESTSDIERLAELLNEAIAFVSRHSVKFNLGVYETKYEADVESSEESQGEGLTEQQIVSALLEKLGSKPPEGMVPTFEDLKASAEKQMDALIKATSLSKLCEDIHAALGVNLGEDVLGAIELLKSPPDTQPTTEPVEEPTVEGSGDVEDVLPPTETRVVETTPAPTLEPVSEPVLSKPAEEPSTDEAKIPDSAENKTEKADDEKTGRKARKLAPKEQK